MVLAALAEALGPEPGGALGDLVLLEDKRRSTFDLVLAALAEEALGDLVEPLGDLVLLDDSSRRRLLVDSALRMSAASIEAVAKKRKASRLSFIVVLWI